MKILIVDDNVAIASSLGRSLVRLGHEPVLAHGPVEALTLLDDKVEAVISDIEMPEMTGVELAQAVHARRPSVRVAFYTASWDQEEIIARATQIGRVMPKPWKHRELADLLERLQQAA